MSAKPQTSIVLVGLSLIAAAAFILVQLSGDEAPAQPDATQWVVFLDLSGSPGPGEAQRWTAAFDRLLDRLRPGDALLIYGVHENTVSAVPLLDAQSRKIVRESGVTEELKARQEFQAMLQDAKEAVRRAFAQPRARATYLIEALHRVPREVNGRRVRIRYYSDMLEQSRYMDLVRQDIRGRETEIARRLAREAGVADLRLGAQVECVLDDFGLGERRAGVNPLRSRGAFWRELFAQAGAELVWFDSRIPE